MDVSHDHYTRNHSCQPSIPHPISHHRDNSLSRSSMKLKLVSVVGRSLGITRVYRPRQRFRSHSSLSADNWDIYLQRTKSQLANQTIDHSPVHEQSQSQRIYYLLKSTRSIDFRGWNLFKFVHFQTWYL